MRVLTFYFFSWRNFFVDGKDISSSGTSLDSSTENDENLPSSQLKIPEKKVAPQVSKRATSLAIPKVVTSISRPPTPTNQIPGSLNRFIPPIRRFFSSLNFLSCNTFSH